MQPSDEHFGRLERMYHAAPINEYFKPRLQVSEGRAEVTIAVRPDFFHAAGAAHGVLYFKALDDATFFAVQSLVTDVFILTASFNLYLTRPVSEGTLHAVGRVVHRSRQLFLAEAELFNGDKLAGRGNGSFMRSTIPLASLTSS